MKATARFTLQQVFGFSLLGLLLGLALLFYIMSNGSEQTLLHSAERYRAMVSGEVGYRVTTYLDEAPMAITHFEQEVKFGLVDPRKTDSVGPALFSVLLANDNISEASFTYATRTGVDADGYAIVDKATAGQIALLRSPDGQFIRKDTWNSGGHFLSNTVHLQPGSAFSWSGLGLPAVDPTEHPTFQTTAKRQFYGEAIWTDLHWSQIDETLPEPQRRVEVSVQKTIEDANGKFAGVIRLGLMKTQIDNAVQLRIAPKGQTDPHFIFLCDAQGRLITGFGNGDRVTVSGDDLRIAPANVPAVVARALRDPVLQQVDADGTPAACSFRMNDQTYLCTFRALPGTQDWIVGIVVPRNYYLGEIVVIRQHLMEASLLLMIAIVLTGGYIIRAVLRSHALILKETARMKEFELSPTQNVSRLRDIQEVLGGLEKAKTAMRAMSKYVPVKLVRQLYRDGVEPVLGGQSAELSVMFTDIKSFTEFAEKMSPDELAVVLGRYLQVVATTIQEEKGTIDKYIGDAVMTFWNAPEPVPGHDLFACRAALRCREALARLYASPAWGDAPRFETRFGLHRCVASVGHFGAPDRLNYTAIGDGINLASRLEGLNKYYGTHIIASQAIQTAAKDRFEFRLLDCVAVKGKTEGIVIYELLGARAEGQPRSAIVIRYEEAFALYRRGDFAAALRLLETQRDDPPSLALAQRCAELAEQPPKNWDGIHVFDMK